MPVKNTEKYLVACLDSIVAQTYTDWELIAVNDHSTDGSNAILNKYAKADKRKRIRVLSNEGTGIISALRMAYRNSKGLYITRMDSDDLMTKQKLELFVARLEEIGEGHIVTGYVEYINDASTPLGEGYRKYAAWLNQLTKEENNYKDIYKECPLASPNWMIVRKDFEKAEAFIPDIYPEDYDLCFRFREKALTISAVQEVTHFWRDYPNRTSRTDDNYKDNKFTALKVYHFVKSDKRDSHQLILWGAGPKGKAVAKELLCRGISFGWVTDNLKKIGQDIYGVVLENADTIINQSSPSQYIIGVSQRGAQEDIERRLASKDQKEIYYFC